MPVRPVEAFSWGERLFDTFTDYADDDPAVVKFPHLFGIEAQPAQTPAPKGFRKPRKAEDA